MTKSMIQMAAGLALLVIPATVALGADELKGTLKDLQGEWTFQAQNGDDGSWVFDQTKVTVTLGNGRKYVTTASVNDQAKPTEIDFKVEEGPDEAVGKTVQGILKREDKKVIIAVAAPENSRPKDFEPIEGEVFVFTLEKK